MGTVTRIEDARPRRVAPRPARPRKAGETQWYCMRCGSEHLWCFASGVVQCADCEAAMSNLTCTTKGDAA